LKQASTARSAAARSRLSASFTTSPTTSLAHFTVSGAFSAMVLANSFTTDSSCSSGTTRLTRPIFSASCALNWRPVKNISLA
jgi:hypothetical protein